MGLFQTLEQTEQRALLGGVQGDPFLDTERKAPILHSTDHLIHIEIKIGDQKRAQSFLLESERKCVQLDQLIDFLDIEQLPRMVIILAGPIDLVDPFDQLGLGDMAEIFRFLQLAQNRVYGLQENGERHRGRPLVPDLSEAGDAA